MNEKDIDENNEIGENVEMEIARVIVNMNGWTKQRSNGNDWTIRVVLRAHTASGSLLVKSAEWIFSFDGGGREVGLRG